MDSINVSLLKRLILELEKDVAVAEQNFATTEDRQRFVVELSKSIGLAVSISNEAIFLIEDIKKNVVQVSSPAENELAKLKALGLVSSGNSGESN